MLASDSDTDAESRLNFSLASDIVELVVFTTDDAFMQTLRDAVGNARRLWHVLSADKVSDLLVAGQVGILMFDVQALSADPGVFVAQMKRQFPDLVLLAAGPREAETSLANLISAGAIYRFIHKPLSPGRAKLFADAAVKKYEEQRRKIAPMPATASKPGSTGRGLPLWAGLGVAGAVLAVAAVFTLQHKKSEPAIYDQPAAQETPVVSRVAPPAESVLSTTGDDSPEFYQQALARNPNDAAARAGLTQVQERLWTRAENALLEERLDDAAVAIEAARKAGVDGGRLGLLSTQLGKSRQRQKNSVRAKDQPASPEAPPVDEHVMQALSRAEERIKVGRLIDPEDDSARFYVQQALRLDPGSNAVQAAKQTLAIALLSEARSAIDRRDFAHAGSLIEAAGGIAAPANLDNARQLLAAARKQNEADAREQLLKNAQDRLRQDKLVDPATDSAKYYLATLRGADAAYPGLAAAVQDLGSREVEAGRRAYVAGQYDAARNWLAEAAAVGYGGADAATLSHEIDVAAAQPVAPSLVPSNELVLVKPVKPVYPVKAEESRKEGWVELDYTVTDTGTVKDVAVHAANPPGVFDAAASRALSQWRYQPPLKDGKPTAVRSRIRIRFTPGA